jgi:hypothetical protein
VQIGNSIATGEPIEGFILKLKKTKVLYLDFELSDKQFEIRYSNNYDDHYSFPDYFFRAEIDPEADVPEGLKKLYASMETAIKETESRILIVDNNLFEI